MFLRNAYIYCNVWNWIFIIATFYFITVRLVNGSTIYEGRVEVQYNGIWITVCDYGWDLRDAQVVCSQLGFGRAIVAQYNAFYGKGSGQSWLYYVNCVGNEMTIGNCSYYGYGYYCSPGNEAGVKCSSGMYIIYAMKN